MSSVEREWCAVFLVASVVFPLIRGRRKRKKEEQRRKRKEKRKKTKGEELLISQRISKNERANRKRQELTFIAVISEEG